ncbi:MAG TPA: hypothetical protein VJO52_02265 [Gemmatimonadaceae bacterium]|nr:hypothetical protein [Gemmatimonadaceae bacterium]
MKVFVDAEADVCMTRRIRRDMRERGRPVEEILEQYETTVRPCTWSSWSHPSATPT